MPGAHQISPARIMGTHQLPRRLDLHGGTITAVSDPASRSRASNSASLRSVFTRQTVRAASCPARPPPSAIPAATAARYKPKPGRTRLITRPHRTRQRPQPRDRPLQPRPNRIRVSSPLTNRSPRHAPTGHGHRAQPTSSFRSWPDLLISGVSRSPSPARQIPARSVRPLSPAGQPMQRAAHAIGSRHTHPMICMRAAWKAAERSIKSSCRIRPDLPASRGRSVGRGWRTYAPPAFRCPPGWQ